MNDEKRRKAVMCCLIAAMIALMAFAVAIEALDTASVNNVFQPVPNNTNLGIGENGNRERLPHVVYNASNYSLFFFLKYHVDANNAAYVVNFTINNTVVAWDADTTIQANVNHSWPGIIVPKGANYSYDNTTTVHHVEIYEYPVLSGKNGTLSINQNVNASGFLPYVGATNNTNTGIYGITTDYLNVTGDSTFNENNISNIRNIIGDHLHILTNASVDSYFNVFSAGSSSNISTIRVSSNATTIASIEQCTSGCHAYNLSWVRVWPAFIDISTPNVYMTGNLTATNVYANNLANASYPINLTNSSQVINIPFQVQNDVSATKFVSTVYRNTCGKTMFVSFSGTQNSGFSVSGVSDSNPSPTTVLDADTQTSPTDFAAVEFMVLNNNYYKIVGLSPTTQYWIEWC